MPSGLNNMDNNLDEQILTIQYFIDDNNKDAKLDIKTIGGFMAMLMAKMEQLS